MYRNIGNAEALRRVWDKNPNKPHCPWLRRDPNACDALPDGIDDTEPGIVCPHNVYAKYPEVFAHRDGVMETIEHLFRLADSAELGILNEGDLDPLSVTELLTTRRELDRQQNEKMKEERARIEAQSNQSKALPSWDQPGTLGHGV